MSVRIDSRIDHGDEAVVAEHHEINVTPFIDVMLVLLIIFMVAAPLATVEMAVNLPGSTAEALPKPSAPIFLTLRLNGELILQEQPLRRDELTVALEQASGGRREEPIFLRADRQVDYGELMSLMNLLREAGYLKIALVGLEERAP